MVNKIVKDSFETIEGITKGVVNDVKQSVTGNYQGDDSNKPKVLSSEDKNKINAQTAQNLARINQQIVEARKKRENKVVQEEHKQVQEKQVKQYETKKKESVLMKLIKSNKGTKEGLPKASG